jgi:hypothetical protein
LAALGLGLAGIFWSVLCTAPGIPWNAARLAPSFALARGLPIYALRSSGAHLGWVYGPVFPLWFLPAGVTDNPTAGLMIAAAWNAVSQVLPLFFVFRLTLPERRGVPLLMTLLGTVLLLGSPITNGSFYFIHVDGLCIAWALVACAALHARVQHGWRPGFAVAALAVALSVATKQVAVVLVPATLLWLWREGQVRLLGAWLFWLATICGGLAVVFFVAFGPEEMLFNAWLLFSRMPWRGGWGQLGTNLIEVLGSCWLWGVAGLLGWLALRSGPGLRPAPEAAAFARLLGWVALVQAPLGLTASLLVDAALNSIHAPTYLLIAGLVLAGSMLTQCAPGVSWTRGLRPGLAIALVAGLGLVVAYHEVVRRAVWTPYRGQEHLLAMVRRAPGSIYLPWNPLTHIIAERKIYPFDEALHYLWLARLEPPREAIRAAVPAGAFILYQEPCQSHFALNYFGKQQPPPERKP